MVLLVLERLLAVLLIACYAVYGAIAVFVPQAIQPVPAFIMCFTAVFVVLGYRRTSV